MSSALRQMLYRTSDMSTKSMKLHAAVVLLSVTLGSTLFGITGVLLAAPLTVVAYVLVKRLYVEETLEGRPVADDE